MLTVALAGGEKVPALGLGTWQMGERADQQASEVKALQAGLDLGMTLVDTAEMYAEGGAEKIVGDAIAGRRDDVFVVSKISPHNASKDGTITACERSLRRLKTECIDLYLLHWRSQHPLADTVNSFERLKAGGKIRHWGVSNFDIRDLDEVRNLSGAGQCIANQVLYHLGERGIEWDLISACRERAIAVMAYTPLGGNAVLRARAVAAVAERHGVATAAVALAWILRHDGMIAIPKTADLDHLEANAKAADLELDDRDLEALNAVFPPPQSASPLAKI